MFFGGDPFEHFAAHGGSRRRRSSASSRKVDTTKLYETLGVPKNAHDKDIKKAYRKLAIVHHPDKGGDEHTFKEVSAAYEILSDSETRAKYDEFGLEGVANAPGSRSSGGGGMDQEDLFRMFFGGSARRRSSAGPRRGEDVNHPLKVSLEDLYNGKMVKLAIERQVMVGRPVPCTSCDGQGVVVELRQIALGMVQQLQRRCADCGGEGYRCKKKRERKVLEVLIEKGMKHKQKIVFRGMADEKPNVEPGNVNIVIQEKDHDSFKRKGADLLVTKSVSLNEALCGFQWPLSHLDGRSIVIQSKPGEIIKAKTNASTPFVKFVPGEGMPSHGNPFVKGNLYVLFRVEFPQDGELDSTILDILRNALPNPSMEIEDDEEHEICHLEHADVKSFGKGGIHNHGSAHESDEEEGPGVQCPQS